jgi:DUF1680 family protein
LKNNQSFELNIPLKRRFVSPHPYTNQDIVALARGPIVYCVEDVDNPWVKDHFKSLLLDPEGTVVETEVPAEVMGESFVAITMLEKLSFLEVNSASAPHMTRASTMKSFDELHFIPYCLRDNRGGNGHMRVGIRRKR